MKIALISHLFPTELHPFSGKFIKDQLALLNNEPGTTADLIVPTPYSIPFTKRYKKNNSATHTDHSSYRLRYVSFPRKKFPHLISSSLSKSVLHFLRDRSYDLIHIHWIYPDALCIPELKKMGYKTVLTIHGSDWYQSIHNRELKKLFLSVLQHTDSILYSGPKLKADVESHFPQFSEKAEIIYNMVDEEDYTVPSSEEKERLRKHLKWDNDTVHSLTVGNIREEKGIDLLLKSIHSKRQFERTHFHVIGAEGPKTYMDEIKSLIDTHSISNVTLYDPVLPGELLQYYKAADFFIQPSRREGFSVALIEAMACGLPVIATNVGGNHLLIDEETGLLIQDHSPESFGNAIQEVTSHYDSYDRKAIHKKVISEYGKTAFKRRLFDAYQDALGDGSV